MAKCAMCGGDAGLLAAKYSKDKVWVCWNCALVINGIYKSREMKDMSCEELKQAYDTRANALAAANKESEKSSIEMWGKLGYVEFPATKKIGNYLWINNETKHWLAPKDVKAKLNLYSDSTIYNYSDIRDFELLEDGTTITSGGLGGAAIGGLLFGGTGAIVGSVTAGKKENQFCSKLQIKITLNNLSNPVVYIDLIDISTRRSSSKFTEAYDSAQEILSVLQLICDENSRTETSLQTTTLSVADEIKKFKELLDAGAITQEEYDLKKKQLLGI